jgi:hypothetical protein
VLLGQSWGGLLAPKYAVYHQQQLKGADYQIAQASAVAAPVRMAT